MSYVKKNTGATNYLKNMWTQIFAYTLNIGRAQEKTVGSYIQLIMELFSQNLNCNKMKFLCLHIFGCQENDNFHRTTPNIRCHNIKNL
ncbi:hypothetical protein HZS_7369 [Henneguya salminicola]|nr:hypothetical protein HZS_7369 [Henneguya salminicola]